MDNWKLVKVENVEFIRDNSDVITFVHAHADGARVDVMTGNNEPLISFQGKGDDVRKALTQWMASVSEKPMDDSGPEGRDFVSLEHAAYLGAQIARAELLKENFVQG